MATFDLGGQTATINGLSGAGTVDNLSATAADLLVGAADTNSTFSGTIQNSAAGPLALTKVGAGTLILSGTNSYTGGTFVDAGTLIVNNSRAIPDGTSLTIGAGGMFMFDSSVAGSPAIGLSHDSMRPSPAGVVAVPEPGTFALLAMGLIMMGLGVWQRKRLINRNFS